MKKISLLLLVTILGSFAACDDEDSPKRSEVMSAQCQDETSHPEKLTTMKFG